MVKAITDAEFKNETEEGVVLIDFWATWCGPCRMQSPIVEWVTKLSSPKWMWMIIQKQHVNLVLCPSQH